MKVFHRFLAGVLLAGTLALGLCAPGFMLAQLHRQLTGQSWAIADGETTYSYEGTLENRIRALDAWQNGSLNLLYREAEGKANGASLWGELYGAGLLPTEGENARCTARRFVLEPKGLPASYAYVEVVCVTETERLHAILDAGTGQCLRVDFTCDAQALSTWMESHPWQDCMAGYAALLGLGALRDLGGEYTNGAAIQGFESDIRGTPLAVSFKFSSQYGLLTYKLFARAMA